MLVALSKVAEDKAMPTAPRDPRAFFEANP